MLYSDINDIQFEIPTMGEVFKYELIMLTYYIQWHGRKLIILLFIQCKLYSATVKINNLRAMLMFLETLESMSPRYLHWRFILIFDYWPILLFIQHKIFSSKRNMHTNLRYSVWSFLNNFFFWQIWLSGV